MSFWRYCENCSAEMQAPTDEQVLNKDYAYTYCGKLIIP